MKQLIIAIRETIIKEKHLLRFLIILFIIGLLFGSIFINFLTLEDKNLLINQLSNYVKSCNTLSSNIFNIKNLLSNFSSNFFELLFIYIFGLSIIGIILVIGIVFFKGFSLGVTLSTFILKYNYKGIIGMLLYLIPTNLLAVAIYFFISFYSCFVSIKFIKAFIKKDNLNFKSFLGKYLFSFILCLVALLVLSALETYLEPILLKLFNYMI